MPYPNVKLPKKRIVNKAMFESPLPSEKQIKLISKRPKHSFFASVASFARRIAIASAFESRR